MEDMDFKLSKADFELDKIFPSQSEYSLLSLINKAIWGIGDGISIERQPLQYVLMYESYRTRRETITKNQSSRAIQILLNKNFLTLSDDNPNPEKELYIRLSEEGRNLLNC